MANKHKHGARYQDIDAERAGQRLDNFLLSCLKGVPRSHVYRLIRSGQVRVNSGRADARYRLEAGDRVRIPPVSTRPRAPESAEDFAWLAARIVYEDSRLLVVDKPAGLAVHGGSGVNLGCIEALRALRPDLKSAELVHRLDRATSGCLLIAKRRSALRALHALLREGGIDKRYLTLVEGLWQRGAAPVDLKLVADRRPGELRVRVDPSGKPSQSVFRLIEAYGRFASYLEVSLPTGRTHQIRVHAAHLGHPVAGDERYGDERFNARMAELGLHRMFLHAHAVAFTWPNSEEPFSISVPLPPELGDVLHALADRGGGGPRRERRSTTT
jgi:23S rRNA pseudouridine955/2504/2580 synthase